MSLRWGVLAVAILAAPAGARTLMVGAGQAYAQPSAAARDAADGDTVLIGPGTYYDCAVWSAPNLTLAGTGPGVVLTDAVCQGKAILVVRGEGTVLRDMTLTRARAPDGNGAGIRLEAGTATVERVRFVNNQAGLLAVGAPGRIAIRECEFEGGGVAGDQPTFAVNAGSATELEVTASVFRATEGGQVRSEAQRSVLHGNRFAITLPGGSIEASGALVMEDNTLDVAGEGDRPVRAIGGPAVLRRNRLVNRTGRTVTMLQDWTGSTPVLDANIVGPGDTATTSEGAWRHRASSLLHGTKDGLRGFAGSAKRTVQDALR